MKHEAPVSPPEDEPRKNSVPESISKARIFWRRFGSSALLWVLVLAGLFSGRTMVSQLIFAVTIAALAAVGLMEFHGLAKARGLACSQGWGLAGGVVFVLGSFGFLAGWAGAGSVAKAAEFEIGFLALFILGLCVSALFDPHKGNGLLAAAITLFGFLYVPWLLNFIQKIHFLPSAGAHGAHYVFFFVLATKCGDMGAYCVGSLIGRHKMIPRVSPGKTWEGFAGAIGFSVAACLVYSAVAGSKLAGITSGHAALLGVLLSSGGVLGDLVESVFKREAGLKDSGRLFPGIGGILDLLDSLLFNAPIMYLYLRHALAP